MKRELKDSIRSADAVSRNADRLRLALFVEVADNTRTLSPELLRAYDVLMLGYNAKCQCPKCGKELLFKAGGLLAFLKYLNELLVEFELELNFLEGEESV